uniref:Uncharacterized protein n=1 Tax=Strigamia maritima TaxID=126957 RepID=T1J1I7_STRMM
MKKDENIVSATFLNHEGNKLCTVTGPVGSTLYHLLDESVENIEGFGSCGGELACTSCHVILSTDDYNRVNDKMGNEECDLLTTHSVLTETSRLGCQVKITKELSGIAVKIAPDILLY